MLRDRLLHGLLALDTESTRAEGHGQLLGRVVETEALESLALGGGLMAAVGAFELVTAAVVLALGIAAVWQLPLLGAVCLVGAVVAAAFTARSRAGQPSGIALTHDLVERMVGQRTLVAQQAAPLRHVEQEAALVRYAGTGRALDGAVALLASVDPARLVDRGGRRAGALARVGRRAARARSPPAWAGRCSPTAPCASSRRRFPRSARRRSRGARCATMFAGGGPRRRRVPRRPLPPPATRSTTSVAPLISARDLSFRYPGRGEPVLTGCALDIRRGDRVLLEGPSGGGKSTLGALLVGLRVPDTRPADVRGRRSARRSACSAGAAGWARRRSSTRTTSSRQTFLFNLLLGRAWPPRREDIAEAEAVLRELDLGPLLARMPSGMEQLVGDSGWQLSHGERSRLFIARSLLQPLDVRVLDESFAALDPETLERALACVLKRAETVVVIAHP